MHSDRWRKLRKILDQALEMKPQARDDFIAHIDAEDPDLGREAASILRAHDEGESRLERPLLRLAGPDAPPFDVGPYRVAEVIGRGGMGKVYLGHRDDDTYQQAVAIKILPLERQSDELLRRFRSERQILASLEHPYIAKLLDGGTTGTGQPFLVMEHVAGLPIDAFCRQQELDVDPSLRLFIKVCEAIHFAHRNLVVHRDLKPSNILVTDDASPKLLDFGIAKILHPESFPQTVVPTRTGLMPMTPEYASPEQVKGEAITTATDVYALGVLLFEMLCGRRPYEIAGGSLESIVEAVCHRKPTKPSLAVNLRTESEKSQRLSRQLAGDLDAIILRALRKEPGERYTSVAQLADDLKRHLDGRPVEARRGTWWYVTSKFVRRHRVAVASLASAFLLLIGFVVVLLVQQQQILHERDRVLLERNRAEAVSGWWFELFKLPAPSRAKGEQVTARELLDKGARSIGTLTDLDLKTELLSTMGHTYVQLGLLREGIDLLAQSVELTRPSTDAPPSDLPSSLLPQRLQRLAEALTLDGEFQRAEAVSREFLELQQRAPEAKVSLALALVRLGHLRDLQGDAADAATWLRQGLEVARQSGDLVALAKALEYSGDERMRRGEVDDARALYRESLDTLRRLHGDLHPDVALMRSNLARTEDGERAEQLFAEAIATQRQLFEGPHPVLATTLNNLGLHYFETQRIGEAKDHLQMALAMQQELYGEHHPKFAVMLGNLANVERHLGHRDRAEALNRQALDIFANRLGTEHADYALGLGNLAELLLDARRFDEASGLVEQALAITTTALGSEHPRMSTLLNSRGQIEIRSGDLEQAEATLKQAVTIADASLGDRHPTLPAALSNLSVVYDRQQRFDEAAEVLNRALGLIEAPGSRTARRLKWLTSLANLELQLGRPESAEGLSREAFDGWTEVAGADSLWTLSAQRLLGESLGRLGRISEAEQLLLSVVERLEATQPAGSPRVDKARRSLDEVRSPTEPPETPPAPPGR